jgi:hypothetical protein
MTEERVALSAERHHPRISPEIAFRGFLETPATTGGGRPRVICGLTRQRESAGKADEVG